MQSAAPRSIRRIGIVGRAGRDSVETAVGRVRQAAERHGLELAREAVLLEGETDGFDPS